MTICPLEVHLPGRVVYRIGTLLIREVRVNVYDRQQKGKLQIAFEKKGVLVYDS